MAAGDRARTKGSGCGALGISWSDPTTGSTSWPDGTGSPHRSGARSWRTPTRSLLVDEQDHGLVFYFPPDDVRLDLFTPTTAPAVCPFKGTATYRQLVGDGIEVLAWSYADPFPEVARLAGYVAFYPGRRRPAGRHGGPGGLGSVSPAKGTSPGLPAWPECLQLFDVRPGRRPAVHRGFSDGGDRGWSTGASCWPRRSWPRRRHSPTTWCARPTPSSPGRSTTPVPSGSTWTSPIRAGPFAGATVTVGQGDRRCATVEPAPRCGPPGRDPPCIAGSPGRAVRTMPSRSACPWSDGELRLVGVADPNDPDEVGPPVLDAWVRYRPGAGPSRTWPGP